MRRQSAHPLPGRFAPALRSISRSKTCIPPGKAVNFPFSQRKAVQNAQVIYPISMQFCCRPPRGGRGLKFFMASWAVLSPTSPPSRGAWIEIKLLNRVRVRYVESPPSRGAWIEINGPGTWAENIGGSPPSRGAWIEIIPSMSYGRGPRSRPPRGGRGLKCLCAILGEHGEASRPPRGGRGLKLSRSW